MTADAGEALVKTLVKASVRVPTEAPGQRRQSVRPCARKPADVRLGCARLPVVAEESIARPRGPWSALPPDGSAEIACGTREGHRCVMHTGTVLNCGAPQGN